MKVREAISTFRGHRVPNVDFIRRTRVWFALSGAIIVLSLIGLIFQGLNFSIEFKGGSLLQFPNKSGATVGQYQAVLNRFGLGEGAQIEFVGANNVQIRTRSLTALDAITTPSPTSPATSSPSAPASPSASPTVTASATPSPSSTASPTTSPVPLPSPTPLPTPKADKVRAAIAAVADITPNSINEQDVGPTWGSTISRKAIEALIVFLLAITLYISLRFEPKMAIAALAALAHDVIITAGIYALVGRQVTPETVIAVLTILGYSLYDTVVIFDKIKENTESALLVNKETYSGVVNISLNQTFMRSVNTSLVVLLPIGSLLLFGGQTLKDFAFALFIGVASGTYSSIFVASPILAILKEREPRYRQIRARADLRSTRPSAVARSVASSSVSVGRAGGAQKPAVKSGSARELEPAGIGTEATTGAVVRTSAPKPKPASAAGGGAKKKPGSGSGKGRPQGKAKRKRR